MSRAMRSASCEGTPRAGGGRPVVVLLALVLVVLAALAGAAPVTAGEHSRRAFSADELEPLIDALDRVGFDRSVVESILYDQRLRKIDRVIRYNAMNPDGYDRYAQYTTPYAMRMARRFLHRHRRLLERAEADYGVPKEILVGILLVETQFGQARLPYRVLEVFTTLAVEDNPLSIERHYERLRTEHPDIDREWLTNRLVEKARFGFKELVAFLAAHLPEAATDDDELLQVRGSYAGALGIPQFLPSSYLLWAVDGNGDGRTDLNQLPDAVASVGNYLRAHGWRRDAGFEEQWRSVWSYNRSPHYVRAVFEIAFRLTAPPPKRRFR